MPVRYFTLMLTTGRSTLQNLLFPQRRQHATEPFTKLWCIQAHMKQSLLTTTHVQINVVEMSALALERANEFKKFSDSKKRERENFFNTSKQLGKNSDKKAKANEESDPLCKVLGRHTDKNNLNDD